jgi:hypothetical protein
VSAYPCDDDFLCIGVTADYNKSAEGQIK